MPASAIVRSTLKDAKAVVVYDVRRGVVIHEITDYAMVLADTEQLSMLTIEQEVGHVIKFWDFLQSTGCDFERTTDVTLRRFRDLELANVLARKSSVGNERVAKTTVNQKLRAVYRWLLWLSAVGILDDQAIGVAGCRVLCGTTWQAKFGARGTGIDEPRRAARHFPLLYRQTGSSSKHRAGFVPTRQHLELVNETLMTSSHSAFVRLRNAIVVDVAANVGLRRGSINSLQVDQFDRRVLEQVRTETVTVKPSRQKFGYDNAFEFPVWLALNICDFIEGARRDFLASKGASAKLQKHGPIFLSWRTAGPMTDRAISQTMSRVMRDCGAPKGAAIHVFRSFYANEQIELEIDRRLALGLDTSTASICAAVSLKLGHRNLQSLFSYVARAQSRRGISDLASQREEIRLLKAQVAALQSARPTDGDA